MEHTDILQEPEAGPSTVSYPSAPAYAFDAAPRCISILSAGEVGSDVRGNFFRSARWCPDGTAVLTTSEDRVFRLMDAPVEGKLETKLTYRSYAQPDAIHASVWYPTASLNHPETFCFAASTRDTPVRLIDATDGRIRATYPIVDHREHFVSPYAMAFSPDASRLYCGHENAIEVLDIATPGPGSAERIKTSSTKRTKGGQKGIISALAFSTDYSGLYAAGSFGGSVSLYQEDHDGSVGHLQGIVGSGVTQVQFHPLSPNHLFVAARRSDIIQIYDLRNPSEQVSCLPRRGDTNQRLWFDLDPWGRYIATGDQDGKVAVWDINATLADPAVAPIYTEQMCKDAIGSIQFHPFKPYLLTASGSRTRLVHEISEESVSDNSTLSDSSDEDSISSSEVSANSNRANGRSQQIHAASPFDDSLRIWDFSSAAS